MTLCELHAKDVIQLKTGENLGRVDDLVFSEKTAGIEKLILHGRPRLFGLLGRDADLEIAWADVRRIGADVVMVEMAPPPERPGRRWRQGENFM